MEDPVKDSSVKHYHALMTEIKGRLDAVEALVPDFPKVEPTFDDLLDVEFCYLQIRYSCELVGLAALIAHHPTGLNSDLVKSWNPAASLAELEKFNERSFPRAIKATRTDGAMRVEVQSGGYLDRRGLQKMYGECCSFLHRGNLKGLLSGKPRLYDVARVDRWGRQLAKLLSQHSILIECSRTYFIVDLGGKDRPVDVTLAQGR